MDMKVMVCSNFSKTFFGKKMKFPNSMRNARFHPPKCRGKVWKMGVLYSHSSKVLDPSLNFLRKHPLKIKKTKKKFGKGRGWGAIGTQPVVCQIVDAASKQLLIANQQLYGHGRLVTSGCSLAVRGCPKLAPAKNFFLLPAHSLCTCGQLLLVGLSTCPPCQTSPKLFIFL